MKILGLVIAAALLWGGGQSLYTASTNKNPTEMKHADYVKAKPAAKWLRLHECRLFLIEAMFEERLGEIKQAYIPVRDPGSEGSGQIHVLLATKDPQILSIMQQLKASKTPADQLKVLAVHKDKALQTRTIQGLVRFGIDLKDDDRKKLAALDKSLSKDFIIVDEGEKPDLTMGLGMTGIGLVILIASGIALFKR